MRKVLLVVICLLIVGCSSSNDLYQTIDGESAYDLVNEENAVLIDVRTKEEYSEDHIAGAINIPLNEIRLDEIKDVVDDFDDNIIVYCRSGARSKEASKLIIDLGYTSVYDLGSINNWVIENE